MPPANLDPIDQSGTAFRVFLNGKRIGLVTRNMTLGSAIWQFKRSEDEPGEGVFSEAQEAADQLAVNFIRRPKRGKKK